MSLRFSGRHLNLLPTQYASATRACRTIAFQCLQPSISRSFTMTSVLRQKTDGGDSDGTATNDLAAAATEQEKNNDGQPKVSNTIRQDPSADDSDRTWEDEPKYSKPPLRRRNLPKPRGKPYSIPELDKWMRVPRSKVSNVLQLEDLQGLPSATWFAHRATRPLLLTFDAFDTLFTPRRPVPKQYCEVAKEFGFTLEEEDVARAFREAFKDLTKQHPNYGKGSGMQPDTWWAKVIRQTMSQTLQDGQGVPEELVKQLYRRFSSKQGYKLFPDVTDFLQLVGTSYQAAKWPPKRTMLGIISNSDPRVRTILNSFGIRIYPSLFPPRYAPHSRKYNPKFGPADFAFATLSYETGNPKPSQLIFADAARDAQSALDQLHRVGRLTRSGYRLLNDVHKEFHHMHVGDELEKDVIPALDSGWDAILLDRQMEASIETRTVDGRQFTAIRDLMCLKKLVTAERLEAEGGQKPVKLPDDDKPIQRRRIAHAYLYGRHILPHPKQMGRSFLL